jgi:TRAP-type C4-dicarboxylate transport system permease small subunit
MLALLRSARQILVKTLEWLVIGLLAVLVLDVLWQVFSRYVLRRPSSWTDELATLLIIWVALLGASVAFLQQGHLGVDYLVAKLPPRLRLPSEIIVHVVVGFFAATILIYGGSKLVALTLLTQQVSPALGVKMGHVYLALPVSGSFILLFSLEGAVRLWRQLGPRKEEV